MIFQPDLVRLISQRKKTMTRRPVKTNRKMGTIRPLPYKVGGTYGVQPGRGKPALFEIAVTNVSRATLGEISFEDARREGFRTPSDFFHAWAQIYKLKPYDEETEAYIGTPDLEQPVWVIEFELPQDRFLRAGMGRDGEDHGDYTYGFGAMAGEPSAVDEATQKQLTKDSRSAEWVRREAEILATRRQLHSAISELASRRDLPDAAAKRLTRMRRDLARLETELALGS